MSSSLRITHAEEKMHRIYPLVFRDGHTEGSWVSVLDNAIEHQVDFATDSNAEAIASLSALKSEILNLNATAEYNLYLVGELVRSERIPEKKTTLRDKFRIDGWYIKAPFIVPPQSGNDDDPLEVCVKLEPKHFLQAGEREGTATTRAFRDSLRINFEHRLNVFWIGEQPPQFKFLK